MRQISSTTAFFYTSTGRDGAPEGRPTRSNGGGGISVGTAPLAAYTAGRGRCRPSSPRHRRSSSSVLQTSITNHHALSVRSRSILKRLMKRKTAITQETRTRTKEPKRAAEFLTRHGPSLYFFFTYYYLRLVPTSFRMLESRTSTHGTSQPRYRGMQRAAGKFLCFRQQQNGGSRVAVLVRSPRRGRCSPLLSALGQPGAYPAVCPAISGGGGEVESRNGPNGAAALFFVSFREPRTRARESARSLFRS